MFEDVQQMFEEIFILITMHFWNGKIEDGLDKIQNVFCQQSLEMDQTIGVAEATSSAIEKEKFVPRGTVHSIAREESRKQHNRDVTCVKNYLEKKLQQFDNKSNKGNKQNKKNDNEKKNKRQQKKNNAKKAKTSHNRQDKDKNKANANESKEVEATNELDHNKEDGETTMDMFLSNPDEL